MPDPGDRVPADGNNTPAEHDNGKPPEHFPELTEEVTPAGIPVLDETVDPSALSPDAGGDA